MPTYTVHQPPHRSGDTAPDTNRFVFVRDGFHLWAMLLPPVWLLLRRLWLVLLLYVLVSAVIAVALVLATQSIELRFAVGTLVCLLIGLEAASLWRWTLARRGYREIGLVSADDAEDAERRFYASWTAQRTSASAAPTPAQQVAAQTAPSAPMSSSMPSAIPLPMRQPTNDVIGLFPQPEGPR